MTTTTILEGPTLRLEPLTLDHIRVLEPIAYNHNNWRYMSTWITNRAELTAWIEAGLRAQGLDTARRWIILLKTTGQAIGTSSFLDLNHHNLTVEIGTTWLAPAFQGAGLNPEAKLLQLDYAFDTLKLNRVAFKTHHKNLQSQAALRKLGATYEGTFRNHTILPDGSLRHSVWFSIIREDWPYIRSKLVTRLSNQPPSSAR